MKKQSQNKPNFRKAKMNANAYLQKDYENKQNWTPGENKPKQTQFLRPQLRRLLITLFGFGCAGLGFMGTAYFQYAYNCSALLLGKNRKI